MRAIALAIMLSGINIRMAIRKETMEDRVFRVHCFVIAVFFVCLMMGW